VKALIKVGYGCNENCTFCHTLDVRHIEGTSDEVHAKIDRARALGHSMVVLSGGEPTIRPELLEWAAHVARVGMDLGLVTNGLMLAYPALVADLLRHRLRYVYMSLHGGSAKVHNSLVRADTFEVACRALGNLTGRGLDLTANCVITKQNVAHLDGVVDRVRVLGDDITVKLSMVQPKGGGERHANALIPTVTEVGAAIVAAFDHGRAQGMSAARLRHDGVPLCHLPGYEDHYADLRTDHFATMVEIGETDFFPVDAVDGVAKIQPAPCRDCALRGPCPGLFAGYQAQFGDGELRPRTGGVRSNSFNYVLESVQVVQRQEPDRCPILDGGISPWDRARHLFVRNGPRLARFVTRTTDFADVELREIKHDRGQIYLDMSQKVAVDDFARELLPLRQSALCAPCPERPRCTGLYEPVPITDEPDWFTRDDQKVRAILGTLRGTVLDIGCGDGPFAYDDLLSSLVASGSIRYLGIDPDAALVASLAERRPWAELRVGVAEELTLAELAEVDHVLILRSWNHLADPSLLLARLAEALHPGASVTVVDNLPFGLARTPAQAERAEQSAARREHLRNHGVVDVEQVLGATSTAGADGRQAWQVLTSLDVGPATSDQWLVRFSRI